MANNLLKKNSRSSGFTLVETLVAISIFTVSVLALLSILAQGISNTNYAKNKIIAGYLAQEGVEYIRNMRDTFVLYDGGGTQVGWDKFNLKIIPSAGALCADAVNGCYFDDSSLDFGIPPLLPQPMKRITLTACVGTCPTLLYDSATGKYGYTVSGTTTKSAFTRKITITPIGLPVNQVRVMSTVTFMQGSGNYNITFSEDLFNWI